MLSLVVVVDGRDEGAKVGQILYRVESKGLRRGGVFNVLSKGETEI